MMRWLKQLLGVFMKAKLEKRVEMAIEALHDMIDGGEECRGRDSEISHIIGILEGDPDAVLAAAYSV